MSMRKKHSVIGIDLGTTYSAVAAFDHFTEMAEIIRNKVDPGDQQTVPSVDSLHPSGRASVGEAARRNIIDDPGSTTVIEIKREMGESFRPKTTDADGNVIPGNIEKFNAEQHYAEGLKAAQEHAVKEN